MPNSQSKSSTALYTAQIVATSALAAAAYLLVPRPFRRGQVAVITGGSRGLGLALAERFGRAGCRLVLAARDPEELDRAQQRLLLRGAVASAGDVLTVALDLTSPDAAEELLRRALERFGTVDLLINNAGIIEVGPVEDLTLATYERAMATNFYAALHTIRAALPTLLRRDRTQGDAAIVNIASIGGKFAMPHLLPYVASKFALVGFSEGLHAELRHKGVRVTTVCPGLMRTGSHIQARFAGDSQAEFRWFALSATTPGLAAGADHAANRIFNAVLRGRAEITITPQAWLAARMVGLAPGVTQYMASLANEYVLPAPNGNTGTVPGVHLETEGVSARRLEMETTQNQRWEEV